MIIAILVFIGFVGLLAMAYRLDRAIDDTRERLRVIAGSYGDAAMLTEARHRLRARQQRVEEAVDTGASGLEIAHRTVSQLFGGPKDHGAGAYARARTVNRGLGRLVSGWFTPGLKRGSESLEDWRARQNVTEDDTDDSDAPR